MEIVGWATYVNQVILEDTSITVGEGGYVEDSVSNGFKERRLTSLAVPDTFSVVMDFDWSEKDSDGLTEYDRFVKWYKYVHKRGTNPFWFPCITKHPVTNLTYTDASKECLYCITSALQPQKSGLSMRVTMTWEEVYSGIVDVSDKTATIDHIEAYDGYMFVYYTPSLPEYLPVTSKSKVYYKLSTVTSWSSMNCTSIIQNGDRLRVSFDTSSLTSGKVYDAGFNATSPKDTFCKG